MQHSFLNAIYQSLLLVSGIGLWISFGDYNSTSRKDLGASRSESTELLPKRVVRVCRMDTGTRSQLTGLPMVQSLTIRKIK